jgi:hypothetical protein
LAFDDVNIYQGLALLTALEMVCALMGLAGANLGGLAEIAASAHAQTAAMTTELARMAFAFVIPVIVALNAKIAFVRAIVQEMVCALRI